jgi:UTP:GlnB (protein PII) uridylyltransferase
VQTGDQRGLLNMLTVAFRAADLDVVKALVDTRDDVVHDQFYIGNVTAAKLRVSGVLQKLESTLAARLQDKDVDSDILDSGGLSVITRSAGCS